MRYPFISPVFGFATGIAIERFLRIPTSWIIIGLMIGILIEVLFLGKRVFRPIFVVLMCFLGFFASRVESAHHYNSIENFCGTEPVRLVGRVDSLPELKIRGRRVIVSLILKAETFRKRQAYSRAKTVYGRVQVFLLQPSFVPDVGDRLRLFGTLKKPSAAFNPGEFDYAHYLGVQGIHAVFQAIGNRSVRRLSSVDWSLARFIAHTRRSMASMIESRYLPSNAAILKALVLGFRSDIAPEIRSRFLRTGTIHILAISGLNITMISGTFFFLLIVLGLEYRIAAACAAVLVIFYIGLAGAGLPVQRAGYGSILVLFGIVTGRSGNLINTISIAALGILLLNPSNLWNVGFQLSFLSVFSLAIIAPQLSGNFWFLRSSLAVLLGTFPLVLYYFNIFSPISLLANLIAIPLFDAVLFLALISLLFYGVPFLSAFFVKGTSWILALGLKWVQLISMVKWGCFYIPEPALWKLAFYYFMLVTWIVLRRGSFASKKRLLVTSSIMLIISGSFFFWQAGEGGFAITLLASGKNQIAHLRFSDRSNWLINTGRSFPNDQGEWLITPYLRSQGVRRLDGIILTDLLKKNTGGLKTILRDFSVRSLFYLNKNQSFEERSLTNTNAIGLSPTRIYVGHAVDIGNEIVEVLSNHRNGTAIMVIGGAWRLLFLTGFNDQIKADLLDKLKNNAVHVLFLPAVGEKGQSLTDFLGFCHQKGLQWIVQWEGEGSVSEFASVHGVNFADLKTSGAITFRRNKSTLEVVSFIKGRMGI